MVDDGGPSDTNDRGNDRYEEKHNFDETKTAKPPVQPKSKKPRTDKDDDGREFVAKTTATDEVLSEKPSTDLMHDARAHFQSEIWQGSGAIALHNIMNFDALDTAEDVPH